MRKIIAALTIATGLALGLAAPAFADEAPTPDPTSAPVVLEAWDYLDMPDSDDRSAWQLDCAAAEWWVLVDHYHAEQTEPGVYADATVTTERVSLGAATGDALESDCPNWVTDDEGAWRDANLDPPVEVFPEALPLDPIDVVELKVGLAIAWKVLGA